MKTASIDTLDGLLFGSILVKKTANELAFRTDPSGKMLCPKCGDQRKMSITCLYANLMKGEHLKQIQLTTTMSGGTFEDAISSVLKQLTPSLWRYQCLQCSSEFIATIYYGPTGRTIAIHSPTFGGLATPNTPETVAYYLDQANKSQLAGAMSAAMAMYRAALEHLLYEQGYNDVRQLGPKIQKLIADIKAGNAPKWANELDTDILDCINKIGNASIHPNNGDITKQEHLDSELLASMSEVFSLLLFIVYEANTKIRGLKEALRSKATAMK